MVEIGWHDPTHRRPGRAVTPQGPITTPSSHHGMKKHLERDIELEKTGPDKPDHMGLIVLTAAYS